MKRRIWMVGAAAVTVVAAGLLGAGAVWAAGPEAATRPADIGGVGETGAAGRPLHRFILGQAGRCMVLRSQLDVTAEQRVKIRAILESHRTQIARVAKAVIAQGRVLRTQVQADKTDEAAIRAAAAGLSQSIGDAAVLAAQVRAQVMPVLTDRQRQAIKAFRGDTEKAVDQLLEELATSPAGPELK